MQSSGHSLEAVTRPSHTAQYAEAVCFLRGEGAVSWGGGGREGERGGGVGWGQGVAADPWPG